MLVDQYGRSHTYLRISVTDRCNLRCTYCMPADGINLRAKDAILTFDEIVQISEMLVEFGIRKIRITGGEPLVRKEVENLCGRLAQIRRLQTLALSTNGANLSDKAAALRRAGVSHVNVSLDTLRPERFQSITRRDRFSDVMRGIEAAVSEEFTSLKINTVVIRGFNDDEILDFVRLAVSLDVNARFIEYMPFPGNDWRKERYVPSNEIRSIIETKYSLEAKQQEESVHGPAADFRVIGTNATIGFISTMSAPFCYGCNRLRLSSDGRLRVCLFAQEGIDLKTPLRNGASAQELQALILGALADKWEKHPGEEELEKKTHGHMIGIGG
ncbi:MAG: GTP 3',8-cyclase MoaA [Ignavibacteria bacterium]|nr:GTP 3',8-cyclase MoaA [Ignavibacteria bacterium]